MCLVGKRTLASGADHRTGGSYGKEQGCVTLWPVISLSGAQNANSRRRNRGWAGKLCLALFSGTAGVRKDIKMPWSSLSSILPSDF